MSNFESIPTSLRHRLERAEELFAMKRPKEAKDILTEVGVELAKSQPELLALIVATQIGQKEFDLDTHDIHVVTTTTYRRVLGMIFGEDVKTTRTEDHKRKRIGLV